MKQETGLANVYYVPTGQLEANGMGATHQHIVLEAGAKVHHYRRGNDSTFEAAVNELFGR